MADNRPHRVKPVITDGSAKVKQDSELMKIAKKFISDDIRGSKETIVDNVLVPKGIELVTSVLKSIIDVIFYGKNSPTYSSTTRVDQVSYQAYYDPVKTTPYYEKPSHSDPILKDPEVKSLEDAKKVIQAMCDILTRYPYATYNDLYDLVGVTNVPYTATKYGWSDFRAAKPVMLPNGRYLIKTPAAMPLE